MDTPVTCRARVRLCALRLRPAPGGYSVLLVPGFGPRDGGLWQLPPHVGGPAHPAGAWPSPPWGPGDPTELLAQAALPGEPGPEGGRYLPPEEALRAHRLGLMVLDFRAYGALAHLLALMGPVDGHGVSPAAGPPPVPAVAAAMAETFTQERRVFPLAAHIRAAPVRAPTLPPNTHTNCYIVGQSAVALVDPGAPDPDEQRALFGALDAHVAQGGSVTGIWITHHHDDHIGAAMAARTRYGAPICAHAATQTALTGRVVVDRLVADGDGLTVSGRRYRALHTPGHAQGHLCFVSPEGHLFAGDHVLGVGTPIVPPGPHGSMAHYLEGLSRLLTMKLGMLLPGHGPPRPEACARLQETLTARLKREALLLDIVARSGAPVLLEALVGQLYRGLGPALAGLAEVATLAHLEKLTAEGTLLAEATPRGPAWRRAVAP